MKRRASSGVASRVRARRQLCYSPGGGREQLLRLVAELDPDVLVMGRPYPSPGPDRFAAAELDAFVEELQEKGHLRVVTPG